MKSRTVITIVLCAGMAAVGFLWGLTSTSYEPTTSPPGACSLVRPELMDRIAPGHGEAAVVGTVATAEAVRATACQWQSEQIWAWVAVATRGRAEGRGPGCGGVLLTRPINRLNTEVPLGEKASYYLVASAGKRTVRLEACLGTHTVSVGLDYPEAADEKVLVANAIALGQEVLSQL